MLAFALMWPCKVQNTPLEFKNTPLKADFMYAFHNLHQCVRSHALYPCACACRGTDNRGNCRILICWMHINVTTSIQCCCSSYFSQSSASQWHARRGKTLQMSIQPPLGVLLLTLIYANWRTFFPKHIFSAFAATNTLRELFLRNMHAVPEPPPPPNYP